MGRIKYCWTNKLKITHKISLTVFCFAFIPILFLFLVIIMNLEEKEKNDKIFLAKSSVNQVYANVQKTVELCNMSTQVFLNNGNLTNYLERVHSGEKISVEDMISFSREDIVSMERLVNSNPYLYQIHVYVDNDAMLEMVPIIYRKSRMKNAEMLIDDNLQYSWLYDYTDDLFQLSSNPTKHVMSLTTKMPSYTYGNLGYVEVAVKMEDVFHGLFQNNESKWSCFIDQAGKRYYNHDEGNRWNNLVEDIMSVASSVDEEISEKIKIQGENMIITTKPIPELGGSYIEVISLDMFGSNLTRSSGFYLFIILGIMVITIAAINPT